MPKKKNDEHAREGFFSVYADYGRILRAWLVAYGEGGPVLFLTQKEIAERIKASGEARTIVYLFLSGVLFQVLIALVNKWVNWYLYAYADLTGAERPAPVGKRRHRPSRSYALAGRISRQFWLDILADGGAIVAFGWATMRCCSSLRLGDRLKEARQPHVPEGFPLIATSLAQEERIAKPFARREEHETNHHRH